MLVLFNFNMSYRQFIVVCLLTVNNCSVITVFVAFVADTNITLSSALQSLMIAITFTHHFICAH